jgi:hypothetical protein
MNAPQPKSPFEKFQALAQGVVEVPKREVDALAKKQKKKRKTGIKNRPAH